MEKLNYTLKFDIKDAADFGVPQRRRRLILLASRGFDIRFAKVSRAYRTVRQAIGDLPDVSVANFRLAPTGRMIGGNGSGGGTAG